MSNARRRRERRLRSWWRHEAQSVAAALSAARHHSAGPREKVVTRREVRQEGEVHEENDGLRAQTTPLSGVRPAHLPEVAAPQAAVTVGYVAAGDPSLAVVEVGAGKGRPPQRGVGGGAERGGTARVALRPTGTDGLASGDAASSTACGCCAAGVA